MIQSLSAEQAKEYHTDELTHSGYYLDDQELKGSFHGRVAGRLGIAGEVDKKTFDALCDNIHPVAYGNLTPRTVNSRTVGYDINYHVPKSVSVLHVLSDDDHILEAFRRSVHATMKDIESDMQTRVRKGGKDEDRRTGELLWADFVHQTARPVKDAEPDPHLHCHCYTFNVTWDEAEQQYKAGQFRDIKRDMPYYEARFHKRLADELVALGYRIRRTGKFFEVEGVPQPVIDLFSKRTNEIGQIAREEGISDARQLDQLGARTRVKKKKHLSMTELKQEWRRQIYALGMAGKDEGGDPLRFAPAKQENDLSAAGCIDHAVLHRFERASVVHDRRLIETAYRFGIGKVAVTLEQITDAFRQDDRIITIQDSGKILCTTREVLAEEKRMVALANDGKGKLAPLFAVAPPLTLTGDQAAAAAHVLTCTDMVAIIRGGAGTGKTTLMQETVSLMRLAGKKVTIVAPTANSSRGVLRQEGFAKADTVAKLLNDPDLQNELQDDVLIVDEAGLLGVKDMTALLQLVTNKNARLIFVGDTRQHSSVTRGDGLRILNTVAGIRAAEVNKIYRQREEGYRKAVEDLAAGNVTAAFDRLDAFGAIRETTPTNPSGQLVQEYMDVINRGKTALVVSPTHKQGEAVTDAIRKALRDGGRIGPDEITVTRYVNLNYTEAKKTDARMYQHGLAVQFNQNLPDIPRGSIWQVGEVSGNRVMIAGTNGKTVPLPFDRAGEFNVYRKTSIGLAVGDTVTITRNGYDRNGKRLNNGQTMQVVSIDDENNIQFKNAATGAIYCLDKDFGHISYGYVTTSHSSQGKTVDEVFISEPAATFPAASLKQFYVSVSRARDRVQIYTDDKAALLEQVSNLGDRLSALELVGPDECSQFIAGHLARLDQSAPRSVPIPTTPLPEQPTETIRPHAPKPVP
ncbi:MobF family relaxase [Niastella populi]|nr:MobF family relaxase [Niastella populi]